MGWLVSLSKVIVPSPKSFIVTDQLPSLPSYWYAPLTPNNYIYTKRPYRITETSVVKLNAKCGLGMNTDLGEHYAVVVSEDGVNFEIVFEEDYNSSKQADKEVNLSAYAGQNLYIGFRHFDCTGQYAIFVDDVKLTDGSVETRGTEPQISAVYPAGKYYLVAAAEDAFTVNVNVEELEGEPEEPVDPEQPADSVVLAAPVVVADTVTETTVTLVWNVVENATSYNVYMDTVLVKNVTDTVYTVTELTSDSTYNFTVTAVADTLESAASNVVTVTTLKSEGIVENAVAFGIYPNPAVDRVVIETESAIESVSIYTLTGVMIYSEVETNNTINVSDLNSGVYFIKVVTSEGETVKRFIKD